MSPQGLSPEALGLTEKIAAALAAGRPVVALESAVIGTGLPPPLNARVARAMEAAVRAAGAVPATICVADGQIVIGADGDLIDRLAVPGAAEKTSTRDLPARLAGGGLGATTVAATLFLAHRAGIQVFATGGIGGVHPGPALDISADLSELGQTPGTVVCAGPKTILDPLLTAEALECLGVPVVGVGTRRLPWFYAAESPAPVGHTVDRIEDAAPIVRWRDRLGLHSAVLVTVPLAADLALDPADLAGWEATAAAEARAAGVSGAALTPFLLARLADLSDGRTLTANQALLIANATAAARLAGVLARS